MSGNWPIVQPPVCLVVRRCLRWRSAIDMEGMAILQHWRKREWARRENGHPGLSIGGAAAATWKPRQAATAISWEDREGRYDIRPDSYPRCCARAWAASGCSGGAPTGCPVRLHMLKVKLQKPCWPISVARTGAVGRLPGTTVYAIVSKLCFAKRAGAVPARAAVGAGAHTGADVLRGSAGPRGGSAEPGVSRCVDGAAGWSSRPPEAPGVARLAHGSSRLRAVGAARAQALRFAGRAACLALGGILGLPPQRGCAPDSAMAVQPTVV